MSVKPIRLPARRKTQWEPFLIAADQLAEQGQDKESLRLRIIGEVIRDSVDLIRRGAREPGNRKERWTTLLDGKAILAFTCPAKEMTVAPYTVGPDGTQRVVFWAHVQRQRAADANDPYLANKAREWAEVIALRLTQD